MYHSTLVEFPVLVTVLVCRIPRVSLTSTEEQCRPSNSMIVVFHAGLDTPFCC